MKGLYVDSVMKAFGDNQVLTDIFFECKVGELIGLLGRNGSGKSTLLKIIFGSLKADQKFVKVDGKQINSLYDKRKLISYLPQDNFLPGHIKLGTIISVCCNKSDTQTLKNDPFLQPLLNRKARHLSAGEKRYAEILIIIHSSAKYILIDEPFNGVAPVYIDKIKALLKKQSEHKGFIVTDHDYRNILDISTRVIMLHDGGTKEISDNTELIRWGYVPVNH